MSRTRKSLAALGMIAVSVVVRCGDDDDDDDKEDKRQSELISSAYAQEAPMPVNLRDGLSALMDLASLVAR